MMNFLLITQNPEIASFAVKCGVRWIFVDLELLGKQERQGHLSTVISRHSVDDVARVATAIPRENLLVRTNPPHPGLAGEVEEILKHRPARLMLPMFRTAAEVADFSKIVGGRAGIVPLVETPEAAAAIGEVARVSGVTEVYIGLNDLHLALGKSFMFEPLADGLVDRMAAELQAAAMPFGFGGIARIGQGELDASLILGEHLRLGSGSVILSRSFHKGARTIEELRDREGFAAEVAKLREAEKRLATRSPEQVETDRRQVRDLVRTIAARPKKI